MSKMDGLRAMREARYEQAMARSAKAAASRPASKPASRPSPAATAPPAEAPAEPGPALCGHRSMNGRSCTREHGHAAKSHRYS